MLQEPAQLRLESSAAYLARRMPPRYSAPADANATPPPDGAQVSAATVW
jgi:hypothetical protein